jgi:hypothetical protein
MTNGSQGEDGPPIPDETSMGEEFEAPSEPDLESEAADLEESIGASAFGADLVALKAEIEGLLVSSARSANAEARVQSVETDNIVGVGLTTIDDEAIAAGAAGAPGEPSLVVYTVEQVSQESLVAEVAQAAGTRALSEMPIQQVPVGVVDAYSHRMRLRPAPGGISVGHVKVTAGTFGCLVRGRSAPRSSRLMVLSNNHVLANSNDAKLGDPIIQPGRVDGGVDPRDRIAILERFVPINFSGGINYVDAATGWAWPDRVRRELMYISGGQIRYFRLGNCVQAPQVGMLVAKSGRTTQLTNGRIQAVGVSVNVNFGGGKMGHFRDQFSVRRASGNFSAPGDSGSVVWTCDSRRCAVGLLFAGGGGTTFCNRISRVLHALDVNLFN